jgi:hypothetical protein
MSARRFGITDAEIRAMRDDAAARGGGFGSKAQNRVRTCENALAGDLQARAVCARHLRADEARERELREPFEPNELRILFPLLGALALVLLVKHSRAT